MSGVGGQKSGKITDVVYGWFLTSYTQMKIYRYGQTSGFSFGQSLEATTNRMLYFALLLHLPHFSKKDFLWRAHLSTSHRRRKPCPSFMGIGSAIYSILLLSDRKKRVNDICMYYCPRKKIKLLCWLCRIGLNKGFFISNSSKNSLPGEYMISLMSFQILHLWGRITSWSPESSGKHGKGRKKFLPL